MDLTTVFRGIGDFWSQFSLEVACGILPPPAPKRQRPTGLSLSGGSWRFWLCSTTLGDCTTSRAIIRRGWSLTGIVSFPKHQVTLASSNFPLEVCASFAPLGKTSWSGQQNHFRWLNLCQRLPQCSHPCSQDLQRLCQEREIRCRWFFGFKIHLIINYRGDLLEVHLTPGTAVRSMPLCICSLALPLKFGRKSGQSSFGLRKIGESSINSTLTKNRCWHSLFKTHVN